MKNRRERRISLKMKECVLSGIEHIIGTKVRDRTVDLEHQLRKVISENKQRLLANFEHLADKVDDLEQYSRRKYLRICKFTEPKKDQLEDTDAIVTGVAKQEGVSFSVSVSFPSCC
jgi:AraC-like DNA-binding protein